MNRRFFFTRMSQAVAAVALATHLQFGNLIPLIPEPVKIRKWFMMHALIPNENGEAELVLSSVAPEDELNAVRHGILPEGIGPVTFYCHDGETNEVLYRHTYHRTGEREAIKKWQSHPSN